MKYNYLIVVALALAIISPSYAAENMKAFPPAEEGMIRHVLQLPEQEDESAFKVELIIGKTVLTDPENRYFFASSIEKKQLKAGGFLVIVLPSWGRWQEH